MSTAPSKDHGLEDSGTATNLLQAEIDTFRGPQRSRWGIPRYFTKIFLAASVATTSIVYYDPVNELRRSGASSVLPTLQRRQRARITLFEARQLALQVLERANAELAQDRAEEARCFAFSWNDDDLL